VTQNWDFSRWTTSTT